MGSWLPLRHGRGRHSLATSGRLLHSEVESHAPSVRSGRLPQQGPRFRYPGVRNGRLSHLRWVWAPSPRKLRPFVTARTPIPLSDCVKRPFFTQGTPVGPLTEPPPVPRVREWEDVRQGCLQARPGLPSREHAESMKAPSRQALRGSGAKGRLRLPGTLPRGGPGRAVMFVGATSPCAC